MVDQNNAIVASLASSRNTLRPDPDFCGCDLVWKWGLANGMFHMVFVGALIQHNWRRGEGTRKKNNT
jgi:hypothetical protein